jgi:hypothetical protein
LNRAAEDQPGSNRAAEGTDSVYMADGPDGSMRGFVRGAVLCLREETWDGGDDSDSTYVPGPDFTAGFRCAPHLADDVPPA